MLVRQLSLRNPFILIFPLLLALMAGAGFIYINPGRPAVAEVITPSVKLMWSVPVPDAISTIFAPDGEAVAVVHPEGGITCYRTDGTVVYSTAVADANTVALAPGGSHAVAFTRLDPLSKHLVFLDGAGQKLWEMDVTGAVWCADACKRGNGARFVIGTGERYIYVVDIQGKRRQYRRWRVGGAVTSIKIDPSGQNITYGTWQNSEIGRISTEGARRWRIDADAGNLHYVSPLRSPERVFVQSIPNRTDADGWYAVLDGTGRSIARGTIGHKQKSRVLWAPNGRYVCMGYEKQLEHEGDSILERHTALYEDQGRRLWDKGSMLFEPVPMAVTSNGCAIVCSGENSLFVIDPTGKMEQSIKLPAAVRSVQSSPDGSRLLVLTRDERMCLLSIEYK